MAGGGFTPVGVFVSVNVKGGKDINNPQNDVGDDWRGLAPMSSTGDNSQEYWTGTNALSGCYGKKPSEFSFDDWRQAVARGEIMPLDLLTVHKPVNRVIIYNINLMPSKSNFNSRSDVCR